MSDTEARPDASDGIVKVGQVWRDTYRLGRSLPPNKRTVRIIAKESDGRWLAEQVTDTAGNSRFGRKTRLKTTTLQFLYELQS